MTVPQLVRPPSPTTVVVATPLAAGVSVVVAVIVAVELMMTGAGGDGVEVSRRVEVPTVMVVVGRTGYV